jgi:hypothetical protein
VTSASTRRATFHYLLAVVVLAGTAVALQAAKSRGVLQLIKKPLPILKPLADLDRACVRPYSVLTFPRLAPETIEDLGTSEYVTWLLQAPEQKVPWRVTQLFVTYYTGVQDQVPHVPDECYYQGAYIRDSDKVLDIDMPDLGRRIAVRRLTFFPPPPRQSTDKVYVYYVICANGDCYADRERVRLRMADWQETHLYYSKVELTFDGVNDGDSPLADQQASELLDKVLAELFKSHWPRAGSEHGGASGGAPR